MLSASHRADAAMDELAKANHRVMKLGGNAITREARMKLLEEDVAKYKDWAAKSAERVSALEKVGNKQASRIASLSKEIDNKAKELEESWVELATLKAQLAKVEARNEETVAMAIRRHRRSTTF